MDPTQLQNLLQTLGSLGSTGLGIAGNNQSYGVLQNALNTIGPTQMGNFSLGGPGGTGSFNLQNGSGSLDFGQLNPAFGSFASAGGAGAAGYNPNLIPGLTSTANSTLSPALANLNNAYGQNAAFSGAAGTQLGSLNNTYNSIYGNTLSSLQAMQQPQVQQQAFGLQNTLFGNGTLNSGGAASGALAAGNFGSQVNAMNAQDALSAQQQALSGMQGQAGIASQLAQTGSGLVSNALSNFGNTNQLISGLNTAGLNNSLSAVQGAGAINTLGLNNYNAGLQTSLAAAQARNGSLFPYAVTASSLAQQPNMLNSLGTALGANGGSLLNTLLGSGSSPGVISQLVKAIPGLSSMFGGGNSGGTLNSLIGAPGDTSTLLGNNFGGYNSGLNLNPNTIDTSGLSLPTGGSGYNGSYDSGNPMSSMWGNSDTGGDPNVVNMSIPNDFGGFNSGTDLSGVSFNGAGGQAATPPPATGGLGIGDIGTGYNAITGLASGTPAGTAAGALDATKLYSDYAGSSAIGGAANAGLGALGIYGGLQRGGVAGDTQAALGGAQLAGQAANAGALGTGSAAAGASSVGAVAGAVAPIVGLGIYAASTPAYTLGSQYYGRVNNTFNQTMAGGISSPDFMSNYDELINAQNSGKIGENTNNAPALSSEQMNQLQSMYQQYLAKYMPWVGQSVGPLGPPVRVGGGGGGARSIAQS